MSPADPPTFHQSRRRVLGLYFDGRYAEALAEVDEQWPRFPEREPTAYFFRMCLQCRLGNVDAALGLFEEALGRGIWWDPERLDDADLDPARVRRGWEARLAQCRRLQAAAGPPPQPVRWEDVPGTYHEYPEEFGPYVERGLAFVARPHTAA